MIRDNINIITWNVQRAGSREFMITLKELIRIHNPAILVLVETRLSGRQMDKIYDTLGFDGVARAEAVGFRGGIWVLWRKAMVNLKQIATHHQSVTVEVERNGEDNWLFSAIYASPSPQNMEELWTHLLGMKGDNLKPWLLMRDFNETSSLEERTGESDNLRRGRDAQTRTAARLDRGLCNFDRRCSFDEASIKHLARNQSDHSPLLLSSNGFLRSNPRNMPFKFQAAWLMHNEFQSFVAGHWETDKELPSALANLAFHLDAWNRDVFGNLFRRRDRFWRRIEGVQKKLCIRSSRSLLCLDRELRHELDSVLDQIQVFWVQKARTDVLRDGDQNTKFFHTCAVVRRKRNKIEGLFDDQGIWHDDPVELQRMVVNHFKMLFSEEVGREGLVDALRGHFPALSERDLSSLEREYS
ncbi:hypothetical protein V2J09_001366 [Rumex salicifolius]